MFEIALGVEEQNVWVQARRGGASTKRHVLGTLDAIEVFTKKVGTAVRRGAAFDETLLAQAHALHEALFQGEVGDALTPMAANEPPLVRLVLEDHRLQKAPWEALCKPGTSEDFLAMGTRVAVARGIASPEPVMSRKIDDALRLLVIAPQEHEAGVQALRNALHGSIESGAIEWLEPLRGERATVFRILDRLRTGALPHIIHFIGHGSVDAVGHPILRLADDEDGDDVWIKAETLGQELKANFRGDLRLLVLEACEGAKPGMFGSAAEIITRAGADAVVSYLWPVQAATSREGSKAFYRTLTAGQTGRGDVLASVGAARRTLLSQGSGGFSLVVYLRGETTRLFNLTTKLEQSNAPFTVPFLQDKRFVGRRDDLEKLHVLLQRDAPIGVSAVTGMGGIGKTQLVVEYAYRHRGDYPGGVYWVNAAVDWQSELARLAEKVGIREQSASEHERQKCLARAFVQYLEQRTGSLVIFDNVEDPLELQNASRDIVPAQLRCRLLFTTRRQTPTFPMVDVRALDEVDALRLLLDTPTRRRVLEAGSAEELATAKSICRTLGNLPLAIALASAHLDKSPRITLDGYLRGLVEHGALLVTDNAKVDPRELATQHAKAVRATLAEQWAAVRESGDAPRVLQTAALLGEAEQIPRARLSLLTGLSDEPEDWRDAPIEEALRELSEYSLIETLTESVIRLHPLVREFAVWKLGDGREAFGEACAMRMADALYDMGRLSNEVERRGVDEVLEDLRAGIGLGERERLGDLLRPLDREAHVLQARDPGKEPAFFLQQLRNRCFELGIDEVWRAAEDKLILDNVSWLRERFPMGNESPALVRTLVGHRHSVTGVAITADSQFVLSASSDNTCKLWDLHSGRCIRTFDGHAKPVTGIAVTTNDKLAVALCANKMICVWLIETGILLQTIEEDSSGLTRIVVPGQAEFFVLSSPHFDLRILDCATGAFLQTLAVHNAAVTPDQRLIVALSWYDTVTLWERESGSLICEFGGDGIRHKAVTVTADGAHVVSTDHEGVRVWHAATGELIRHYRLRHLAFFVLDSVGQRVFSRAGRSVEIWNLHTGADIDKLQGHAGSVITVALTANGKFAVSASTDATLRVWDLGIAGSRATSLATENDTPAITSLTFAADGRFAISGSVDYYGGIHIWDVALRKRIRTLEPDEAAPMAIQWHENEPYYGRRAAGAVVALAVTSDTKFAIATYAQDVTRVFDLQSGVIFRSFPRGTLAVNTARGPRAISGTRERGTFHAYSIITTGVITEFVGHTDSVTTVATLPNNEIVTGSKDTSLRIWDMNSGRTLRILTGHTTRIHKVIATSNGKRVFSVAGNKIRIWSVGSGRTIGAISPNNGIISDVALTPDDQFIVSVSQDRTLRIWDIETRQQLAMLEAHAPLLCCAVSPDGKTILAGDQAGGLHILDWHRGNLRRGAQEPT